jgi:8-oxo-dGTP diphosphatase
VSNIVRVVAAVIARGDHLLVCQRPLQKRYGGLWEFPGGKCGPNESIAAAARRELREELGVRVIEVGNEQIAIPDPGSSYLIVFTPVGVVGEPICNEHLQLLWASPSELTKIPLAPTDKLYVQFRFASSDLIEGDNTE